MHESISEMIKSEYESWDLTPLMLPPRSRLLCLKPVGIGTIYVESLTSYITRLAEAHSVTIESLFGIELVPLVDKPYLTPLTKTPKLMITFQRVAHGFNGVGDMAKDWIAALEALTMRDDLRHLTMLTMRPLLSSLTLLRKTRAWCPHCYNEQRSSNNTAYNQLLWTLEAVSACPRHLRKLEVKCPHCKCQFLPLTRKMRIGLCDRCGKWLGFIRTTRNSKQLESEADLCERIETATLIGDMLAAAPFSNELFSKERLAATLKYYINQLPPYSLTSLGKLIKVSYGTIAAIALGKLTVRLDVLIRICKTFKSSVSDFLNGIKGEISTQMLDDLCAYKLSRHSDKQKRKEILRHLQGAIQSPDCPSLRELSKQLGFTSISPLMIVSAELCNRITARYMERRSLRLHLHQEHVSKVFFEAMNKEPPPTVKEVALKSGYTSESVFRSKYSDMTKSLVERRKEYHRIESSKIEVLLLASLKDEPPPSLKELCGRLTYKDKFFKDVQSLRSMFPVLCRAISARYKTLKQQSELYIE